MNVYGRINHINRLGVDIQINEDNTLNLDEMYIGSVDIDIGDRLLEIGSNLEERSKLSSGSTTME